MQRRRLQLRHATCCCSNSCLGNFTCRLWLLPLGAKCYKSRISTAVAAYSTYSSLCALYALCLKEKLKHARTHSIITMYQRGNILVQVINRRCCCCMPQLKQYFACGNNCCFVIVLKLPAA